MLQPDHGLLLPVSVRGLDAVGATYAGRPFQNPDGPFFDAEGNDMREVKADPSLPIFDDRSIEPYGVKLMGNYLFKRLIGDPGTGSAPGPYRRAITPSIMMNRAKEHSLSFTAAFRAGRA